ncbi:hypothetical protein [Microbacterium sp. gxy059]|uniref:hypothetical protein n=1 Tax=Microbacterium sp. gxy059 TaxID=2957199 RepID=UPI003D987D26
MNDTLKRTGIVAALLAAGVIGLAGCASDAEEPAGGGDGGAATEQDAGEESAEFVADLEEGVQIVNDQLAEQPDLTQIMLASDVDQPTQKYGMWVMPYHPSDAVEKYISTIQVADGEFVVEATSAETGTVWQMDQDGALAEAGE